MSRQFARLVRGLQTALVLDFSKPPASTADSVDVSALLRGVERRQGHLTHLSVASPKTEAHCQLVGHVASLVQASLQMAHLALCSTPAELRLSRLSRCHWQ